jgi:hypothetical protein
MGNRRTGSAKQGGVLDGKHRQQLLKVVAPAKPGVISATFLLNFLACGTRFGSFSFFYCHSELY